MLLALYNFLKEEWGDTSKMTPFRPETITQKELNKYGYKTVCIIKKSDL